jgi:hypothetical protein
MSTGRATETKCCRYRPSASAAAAPSATPIVTGSFPILIQELPLERLPVLFPEVGGIQFGEESVQLDRIGHSSYLKRYQARRAVCRPFGVRGFEKSEVSRLIQI